MLPDQSIDKKTLRLVRELVRGNFAARDELCAAAEALNDDDLVEICRRLADDLGGHAADLQQLLMIVGQQPPEPDATHAAMRYLQEIVTEVLGKRRGQPAVLGEAEAAEHQLKQAYDAVIHVVPNVKVEGLLRRQRDDVAFGETVLKKVRQTEEENR